MEHNPFTALLLISALALIVPILANRFRRLQIPIVVGEIFAGILIGRSGLNLVEPSPILSFLAEFGFAYLMFLSGLEIDFRLLIPTRQGEKVSLRNPLAQALLIFAGTLLLGLALSSLLARIGMVESSLLMGLILSTTSLGVVVPILKQRDLLPTRFGQTILASASVADFATLLLLTIVIAIQSQGLTLDLLLIPVLLLAFLATARFTRRLSRAGGLQRVLQELSSATAQIRVRGAFALMVGWVVLAEALGVELILGAFLAGAIAGLLPETEDERAEEKLDAIGYGFFIPIFFIMVGAELNLRALFASPQAILLLPLLIMAAFIVKIIPALLLRLSFTWRETLAGGILLSSRLSLIIAASSISLGLGLISDSINTAIILLAVISCILAPVTFNRLYPERPREERRGIILVGQDQLVEFLADRLLGGGDPITVLCPDQSRVDAFRRLGVRVVGDCKSLEQALENAGAGDARVLVDLTTSPEDTLRVCEIARRQFTIPTVVSRISDVDLIPELRGLGVKVVQPALATAMALEGALRYPTIFDVLAHEAGDEISVVEVRLANPALAGRALRTIRLPGDALILSLHRDGETVVPHTDHVLKLGDRLGLIGSPQALERAELLLLAG